MSGQLSTYLASWDETSAAANTVHLILMGLPVAEYQHSIPGPTNLESTITEENKNVLLILPWHKTYLHTYGYEVSFQLCTAAGLYTREYS